LPLWIVDERYLRLADAGLLNATYVGNHLAFPKQGDRAGFFYRCVPERVSRDQVQHIRKYHFSFTPVIDYGDAVSALGEGPGTTDAPATRLLGRLVRVVQRWVWFDRVNYRQVLVLGRDNLNYDREAVSLGWTVHKREGPLGTPQVALTALMCFSPAGDLNVFIYPTGEEKRYFARSEGDDLEYLLALDDLAFGEFGEFQMDGGLILHEGPYMGYLRPSEDGWGLPDYRYPQFLGEPTDEQWLSAIPWALTYIHDI